MVVVSPAIRELTRSRIITPDGARELVQSVMKVRAEALV